MHLTTPSPRKRPVVSRSRGEARPPTAVATDPMTVPIRELMTRDLVCVFDDFNVDTLEAILLERGLSAVPVINNDGKLVGFATMTDIVRVAHDRNDTAELETRRVLQWGFHEMPEPPIVGQLMSPIELELPPSCTVQEAIAAMASRSVHRVPVVDDAGQLVGIVTAGDIVRYVAGFKRPPIEEVNGVPCIVPPETEWRPYDALH